MQTIPPEFRAEYQKENRDKTIVKTQWGCIFGILLVPLFGGLDFYVFPHDQAMAFLRLRLLCSALMALLYPVLGTSFGKKYYQLQGLILLFLPSATIAWMVYATEGTASPYYAGLTLVLMVLAVVLDWTFWQSVISVVLVLLLYLTASLCSPAAFKADLLINNLFFLVSSGTAIIAGAYYHSNARIREFLLNKQLVQSEKMAATGIMSAGIIHNINNPLNFATTGLFTLRKKGRQLPAEQQADYAEVLTDIEDGLKRVQTIVSSLRPLTHPGTGQSGTGQPKIEQRGPVRVAEAIQEALRFLDKGTVEITQELAEHQTIWANKDRLVQVIENLLKNSLDALMTKTFAAGDRPAIWITGRVENGHSILSIRDNGPGIADRDRPKIFDPFFTTKAVGAGMGLGLSNCYGIVREYGGTISLETVPGKFCEFILEFPPRPNQAVT